MKKLILGSLCFLLLGFSKTAFSYVDITNDSKLVKPEARPRFLKQAPE